MNINKYSCSSALVTLKTCAESVRDWMYANKLQLNEDKTEAIHFSSKNRKFCHISSIIVGDAEIHFEKSVQNLGVVFDSNDYGPSHQEGSSISQFCTSQHRSDQELFGQIYHREADTSS